MTLLLSGTNGVSDVDGTAATPAIRGSDTNTGIFFPAADTIAFAEGGVESMRLDSAGNLGIGTSSPAVKLHAYGSGTYVAGVESTSAFAYLGLRSSGSSGSMSDPSVGVGANVDALAFRAGAAERARITSSGDLLVGTTSAIDSARLSVRTAGGTVISSQVAANSNYVLAAVNASGSVVGGVIANASSTSFPTSSDYRLKNSIAPMTGALAKVAALKPVTYKWNVDGSDGEGFIAHELAEVCPQAVVGEKDAVDAEGNPVYQGIDTSFLVATLTAAIQELHAQHIELKAIVDQQATEIANLKGQA